MDGPLKGSVLERIPCYQTTWREWRELHPETDVIAWRETPLHRDARHGHGSDCYPGRPGMHLHFLRILEKTGFVMDARLPENALVLGIDSNGSTSAYPLLEVKKNGCVVNDVVGGEPIVVFAAPGDSFTMSAFSRRLKGEELEFRLEEKRFRDAQTGSAWNIEGRAVAGPLAGESLDPLDFVFVQWHAWCCYHPSTAVYRCAAAQPPEVDDRDFRDLFAGLADAGYRVAVEGRIINAWLPGGAQIGFSLSIDGDAVHVYRFAGEKDAEDYAFVEERALRFGRYVFRSGLAEQLPAGGQISSTLYKVLSEVPKSKLLGDKRFTGALEEITSGLGAARDGGRNAAGFVDFCRALAASGYKVSRPSMLLDNSLPAGCSAGFSFFIKNDRFRFLKFESAEAARAYCATRKHSIAAQRFVVESDPAKQYRNLELQTLMLPDEKIKWSSLLRDGKFVGAMIHTFGGG